MEVIVVILCLIILVGMVVTFNYAENVQKKMKDLEESINIVQEQKEAYKREILKLRIENERLKKNYMVQKKEDGTLEYIRLKPKNSK